MSDAKLDAARSVIGFGRMLTVTSQALGVSGRTLYRHLTLASAT
jgi:hypothetical protein